MRHTTLLLTLLLAGCGADPGARLVGKWEGRVEGLEKVVAKKFDVTEADADAKRVAEELSKAEAQEALQNLRLEDEFRADGTCVSTANGNPVEGTWKVVESSGDRVVVERGTKGASAHTIVTLRFDGPEKYQVETVGGNVNLVFTRKK